MGKLKDLYNGEHKTFVWFVTVTTVIFLLLWLIGPGNTIIHWMKAGNEIKRQEAQIEEYARQIESMEDRINTLTTDRDSLEKFARERLDFAVSGEDVYIIEE